MKTASSLFLCVITNETFRRYWKKGIQTYDIIESAIHTYIPITKSIQLIKLLENKNIIDQSISNAYTHVYIISVSNIGIEIKKRCRVER